MKPISRLGIGSLSILQLLCAVLLFLSLAYLSSQYFKVWDFTKNNEFTLSDLSRKILQNEGIAKREKPARLILAFPKSSPHYQRVQRVVDSFVRASDGKLTATYIDTFRETDATTALASAYNLTLNSELLIVDTREDETEPVSPANTRFLPVSELIVFSTDSNNQRRPIGYQIEDQIATALLSLSEGQPRKLYFLADKSPLDSAGPGSPWEVLTDTLARQNLALVPINISEIDAIPQDAEAVVLIAPSYDLEEKDLEVLEEYWLRPGAAMLALLDPAHRPPRLRSFLRRHGITPNDDRVLTVKNNRVINQITATFTGFEGTNDGLNNQSTTLEGPTCSLSVRESAEDLNSQNIFPIILLESSPSYWGETRFRELKEIPSFSPAEDFRNDSGLPLAAAVIVGDATSDEASSAAARMVAVSNVHFLHPDRLRAEQIDFLRNSVNWMIGREQLVGVGPRGLRTYKLNLLTPQVAFVNRLNLFFIPLGLLLCGFFIWNARRA
ncbi:MAG: Gldg family protein [Verrucomicrobiota bacterium JB023]|nr:Gldg family protein [Verrucomicrobiota bacterium JB023]